MSTPIARREFLAGIAAVTAAHAIPSFGAPKDSSSPFRIAVINDEISQDFGHVCEVAARDFGMRWIELRSMWKKNIVSLDEKEVAEARRIIEKNQLKVTDIASPLFKVDWPGAPKSKFSEAKSFNAAFDWKQQDEVLERAIEMAKVFDTDRVRCFDFWRLEDQTPYRAAMNDKLREAAEKCGKSGLILVLENEPACLW
jgi:L-ribulose-5-phosphate 3-epimerase